MLTTTLLTIRFTEIVILVKKLKEDHKAANHKRIIILLRSTTSNRHHQHVVHLDALRCCIYPTLWSLWWLAYSLLVLSVFYPISLYHIAYNVLDVQKASPTQATSSNEANVHCIRCSCKLVCCRLATKEPS